MGVYIKNEIGALEQIIMLWIWHSCNDIRSESNCLILLGLFSILCPIMLKDDSKGIITPPIYYIFCLKKHNGFKADFLPYSEEHNSKFQLDSQTISIVIPF